MVSPSSPVKVVYFSSQPSVTTNLVAGLLEQMGMKVVLVVGTPGTKRRPTDAYKDAAANLLPGLDMLITSHMPRLAGMLRGLEPDLILVTGFPWRLPADVLSVPRLGAVNMHPALLPAYRGPDPLFWQILNEEPYVGMTIHRMDPEFDTGPILAQDKAPITLDDTAEEVAAKLGPLGAALLPKALEAVLAGESGTQQSEQGASYARLRTEEDRILDWSQPARSLHNRVRAWGFRGAIGQLDGQSWLVRRSRVEASPSQTARPGKLLNHSSGNRAVQTGDGLLVLVDAEPVSQQNPTH